jgi:hypothetical protein
MLSESKSNPVVVSTNKPNMRSFYPERNKSIGQYRVDRLKELYEIDGYKVTTFPVEAEGIDLIAENEDHVILAEVTNWNENGYLTPKRINSMVSNWEEKENDYKLNKDTRVIRRLLVYSFKKNIELVLLMLFNAEVELKQIGKQDIPPEETKGWVDNG